jgi:CBS domain-containing protein
MTTVAKVLSIKGYKIETIDGRRTVLEAIVMMLERNVGSLIVTLAGRTAGIFTERDYLRRVAIQGRPPRETLVEAVMTRHLTSVSAEMDLSDCLGVMSERQIRQLPVFQDDGLTGIVSEGDLMERLASERKWAMEELLHYIQGR